MQRGWATVDEETDYRLYGPPRLRVILELTPMRHQRVPVGRRLAQLLKSLGRRHGFHARIREWQDAQSEAAPHKASA